MIMNTYIVTGCAGFIGSHLTEALLAVGHEVIGIDNFETGLIENLEWPLKQGHFKLINADISNADEVNNLISNLGYQKIDIDGMFHVAARARIQVSLDNPGRTFACNVDGTFNMLELCRALKINNFVYSASSSAYGMTNKLPNHPADKTNCLNPYSVSKLIGEQLCSTWSKCFGTNTISLRYFNVYGPRSQLTSIYAPVIGIFFRQLLQENHPITIVGDGTQKRDFTYVSDVVAANINAMEKCEFLSGKVFNIGTGKNYSINEIASIIGGEREYIQARPAEAKETLADISDSERELDYKPAVYLKDGIELMRKHYTKLFNNE